MRQVALEKCTICGLPIIGAEIVTFHGTQWGGISVEHADPRTCIRRVAIVAIEAAASVVSGARE